MTIRFYSLKRPKGWFWSNGYKLAEILASHRDGEISDDWKISRNEISDYVVTVAEFLEDPEIFEREIELRRQEEREERAEVTMRKAEHATDEPGMPKKECPDCDGVMRAIKIVAGGSDTHHPIQFTCHDDLGGIYYYRIEGDVRAYLCDDCKGVRLYGDRY